jgi:hypothetical protein
VFTQCPDENVFARNQAKLQTAEEADAFERHLDACPACLELAAALGMLGDGGDQHSPIGGAARAPSLASRARLDACGLRSTNTCLIRRMLLVSLTVIANSHWGYSTVPAATLGLILQPFGLERFAAEASLQMVWTAYVAFWGITGPVWGTLVLTSVLVGWKWARKALGAYLILSAFSLALAPICAVTWLVFKRWLVSTVQRT